MTKKNTKTKHSFVVTLSFDEFIKYRDAANFIRTLEDKYIDCRLPPIRRVTVSPIGEK